jgi:hypothetical protein
MTNQVQTVYIPCFCGCSSAVNFGNNTRSLSHHWTAWLKHKNKTWPLAPLHDLLFCFPLQRPCAPTCSPSKALDPPRALSSPTTTLSIYQPTHQFQIQRHTVAMAKTGIFHHVGTVLLFIAAILLLITTISAPVIGDIAILKVMLTNKTDIRNSSVTFGTFGHCVLDVAPVQ